MFNANRPQVHGGKVTNAYQGDQGGGLSSILGLAAGLGLGLGTGNWAPLIGNVLGPTAGSIYGGATTGDWSQLGNQVTQGKGMFGSEPGQGGSGSGGGAGAAGSTFGADAGAAASQVPGQDMWNNTSPELASERMIPQLGQPLSSLQDNTQSTQQQQQQLGMASGAAAAMAPFSDPNRWY